MTIRKIPFGLRDGKLLQPDQVLRGLACNCVCPGCGARLVAHHGEKKIKHFVHYSIACAHGFESSIHKAAKQVLLESKKLFVPAIHASEYISDRGSNISIREKQSIDGRFISLESVEVEKNLGNVVPDLVVVGFGKELYVEIAYTHFVDEEKRSKLRALGVPTVEIDLSGLSEVPNMDELAHLVVEEPSNRYWINNPKHDELRKRVVELAKQKLATAVAEDQIKREKYRQWAERYRNMSDEGRMSVELKKLKMKRSQLPDFLGVFVKGCGSFSSHNRVWQTAIYTNFIYQNEDGSFDTDEVCNWCYQFFIIKRVFPNSEKIAVWYFMKHLEKLGLIWHLGRQAFYVKSDKITKSISNSDIHIDGLSSETDLPF